MKNPPLGLVHEATIPVDETLVVPSLPNALSAMVDMPPVFATAYMVAFIEATCIEALTPFLEAGEGSVGTQISMTHLAATPIGMAVTAQVELVAAEGRKLTFQVICKDEQDVIGEGRHERFVIDRDRFSAKLVTKQASKIGK